MVVQRTVSMRIKSLSGTVFASDSGDGSTSSFVGKVTVPNADVLQNVSCLIDRGLRFVGVGCGGCCCEGSSCQTRTVCRVDRCVGVALVVVVVVVVAIVVVTFAQLGGVAQVDKARDSFRMVHCTEVVGWVGWLACCAWTIYKCKAGMKRRQEGVIIPMLRMDVTVQ